MLVVEKDTLQVFDASQLPYMPEYRHIQFDFGDLVSVAEALDSAGLAILRMPDQPVHDHRYQRVTVGAVAVNGGVYSSTWTPEYIELTSSQRIDLIAEKRYAVETGGVNVLGYDVPTDRDSRGFIKAMYDKARDDSGHVVRFKMPSGFVTLDATTIIAVGDAVYDHVQAAFAREDELLALIEQGDPITPDDWA